MRQFLLSFVLAGSAAILTIRVDAVVAASAAACSSISSSASSVRLADDRGLDVCLDHPARRIVSLSPNITELVFAAGAGDRLVGVSRYSDYPDSARSLPDIGDASSVDVERIVALRPDLVVVWRSGTAQSDIEKLERLGLLVFVTEPLMLGDISRLLRAVGVLAGTSLQAEQAARTYEGALQQIKRRYANRRKIRVVHLIWHQPLMTVNGNHIVSDIIGLCGGINVFASVPSLTPVISEEDLLRTDPQAILSSAVPGGAEIGTAAFLRRIPQVSAVRNNHLFFIHPDLILRQTTRLLQGAKLFCDRLERVRSDQEWKRPDRH